MIRWLQIELYLYFTPTTNIMHNDWFVQRLKHYAHNNFIFSALIFIHWNLTNIQRSQKKKSLHLLLQHSMSSQQSMPFSLHWSPALDFSTIFLPEGAQIFNEVSVSKIQFLLQHFPLAHNPPSSTHWSSDSNFSTWFIPDI